MRATFTAGDSVSFSTSYQSYPASGGWSLRYRLVPISANGAVIEWTCTADGDAHATTLTPTVTADWIAGDYTWSAIASTDTERVTVESGRCTVAPDPDAAVAGYDSRSTIEKSIADLKTAYATFMASQGHVSEYEIAGRRMRFSTGADILQRISVLERWLAQERQAQAIASGTTRPNKLRVRF